MIRLFLSIALMLSLAAAAVQECAAQAALNAPPEDPVYHAIDVFVAHEMVNNVIMGQRPFSRLEIARILKEARAAYERMVQAEGQHLDDWKRFQKQVRKRRYLDHLLSFYEKAYARELAGMRKGVLFDGLRRVDLTMLYNSSAPRVIPQNNGAGTIDGIITSFDQDEQGKTYVEGVNQYLSTYHDLYASKYFAMTAQPRFEFLFPRDGDMQVHAYVHRLYGKAAWKNVELEVGRDNLLWGQGAFGGLMASAHPRPLDMIKLSDPSPFKLPWIFGYLGNMKFTFFVANLGPQRVRKDPYFYGAKWSLRPSRWFEFGLSHTITMGGEGAPSVKWYEPITELMPFHKWGGSNVGQADIANNAWGFLDFRLTLPPLRSSILYYDAYVEDSIVRAFRLPDNLLNQLAFVAGWYMPRLSDTGSLSLRLEYRHTPPLAYRHSGWASGYVENQRVIGDAIGPDADAISATLSWYPHPRVLGHIQLAYQDYDSSTYYTEYDEKGYGNRILKLTSGPHERRYRGMVGVDWRGKRNYGIRLTSGYEYRQNASFEMGKTVHDFLLGATLKLFFDQFRLATH